MNRGAPMPYMPSAAPSAPPFLSSPLASRPSSLTVHRSSFSAHRFLVLVVPALCLTGCGSYEPTTPPPAAPAAIEPDTAGNTPTAPESDPADAPGDADANPPPSASAPPTASPTGAATSPAATEYPVDLSTGVALAQTGPDGVLMSFSVDYEFAGQPDASCQYVWVIKRNRGEPASIAVNLKDEGTLETLVPKWRPEEGPFEAQIVERCSGRDRQVSKSIALERTGE